MFGLNKINYKVEVAKMQFISLVAVLLVFVNISVAKPPHIVFILADDYGFHDIGYHNNKVLTPNLDTLASTGIRLDNYYVQPICTPTRSQLMSGRYQVSETCIHPKGEKIKKKIRYE